jgi:hypothetical protein
VGPDEEAPFAYYKQQKERKEKKRKARPMPSGLLDE